MNYNEHENNESIDILPEFSENAVPQQEAFDLHEPEHPLAVPSDFVDAEDPSLLEVAPDEDEYIEPEIIIAEVESTEQEFMVFAADGTLLQHNMPEHTFERQPMLTTDDAVYGELASDVQPPPTPYNDHMRGVTTMAIEPRNAMLNVNVGGWSNISAAGWTSGAINVTSNIVWTLSRSATWLTPSIELRTYQGSGGFTVAVAPNNTATSRTGMITLSGSGIVRHIQFTQLGAVNLTVSATGWTGIPASGWTSGVIHVTTNITWHLSRNVTWLTTSLAPGNWSSSRSFTVTVAPNTIPASRVGTVSVSGNGATRNISFTQLGANPAATLTVTPTTGWSGLSAAGGTFGAINVTSNIVWTLSRSVTWLTPSIALGNWYRSGGFNVAVARNTSTAARTGNITISGSGMTRNVSFQQLGANTTPIRTVTFSANGGTVNEMIRSVTNGNQIGLLPTPTRVNHRFVGWFNTSATTGGTEITSSFVVTSDLSLWARWRINRQPMSTRMITESPAINGRVVQIRRFECHPEHFQIQLLSATNGNLDRPGTGASFFVNSGVRTGSRVMTALHWMNGRALHTGGENNFADRDAGLNNATVRSNTAMSCMFYDSSTQPRLVSRVVNIDGLPISRSEARWAIGGISLLLNETHVNNDSIRNRYLGLNGAAAFYPNMPEAFIPGLRTGNARAFIAYCPQRDVVTFGVISPTINTSISNSTITYFDMYTALRGLGFRIGMNIDGGGSTRFRNGATTTAVGARDVVCQLTHTGL